MMAGESQVEYEEQHVHQVYDQIASHFSSTRFKPWPVVDRFIKSLRKGAVGLDIGCGNGKYLTVRKDIFIVASDRSSELLKFAAQHQPHSAVIADTLFLPHPDFTFDFAICIAVIHHLSTSERRRDGIRSILQTLRPAKSNTQRSSQPGQALIFVWALEQKNSRRGWDEGMEQDVLVPWVLKSEPVGAKSKLAEKETNATSKPLTSLDNEVSPLNTTEKTFHRYYHLYRDGELREDIVAAGGRIVEEGYDKDNWWAICEPQ